MPSMPPIPAPKPKTEDLRRLPTTGANSSFSSTLWSLQLGIDSTSLGLLKTCPRKYYYEIVEGWEPKATSVHLTFGLLLHKAREVYEHQKSAGAKHASALRGALRGALKATWNKDLSRPWISDHKFKNRFSLLRTIVWYLDAMGEEDALETLKLTNGKPAVELSFRFDSGYTSRATGEPFVFCGHLDRLAAFGGQAVISDIKTTGGTLDPKFFDSFSPDNQMSMYTLAGKIAFGQEVKQVVVDGVQIGVNFSRFQRGLVARPPSVLDEWYDAQGPWLQILEAFAIRGEGLKIADKDPSAGWPQNDKACGNYGGCAFRGVCSKAPGSRGAFLRAGFKRRVWDPLQVRGDI